MAGISTVARLSSCGRRRVSKDVEPEVRRREIEQGRHVAHFCNVVLCGLVWLCPVCAPRIRHERAVELDKACAWWLTEHPTGSVLLVTLTMPHDVGDSLSLLFGALKDGWRAVLAGKAGQAMRARFGVAHWVRALDVTVGPNGWHPHVHAILFTDRKLLADERDALTANVRGRWVGAITGAGFRAPGERVGVQIEAARSRKDVSRYVCQVVGEGDDDSAWGIANEVTRTDLKRARHDGHRTPWQVVEDFAARRARAGEWSDSDDAADDRDRALWQEYERATARQQAIRWSDGLRALAGLDEKPTTVNIDGHEQETKPAVELGGEVVYTFSDAGEWLSVCDTRGGRARVLRAAERWGARGCSRMVVVLVRRWRAKRAAAQKRDTERRRAGLRVAGTVEIEVAVTVSETVARGVAPNVAPQRRSVLVGARNLCSHRDSMDSSR